MFLLIFFKSLIIFLMNIINFLRLSEIKNKFSMNPLTLPLLEGLQCV